MLHRGRAVEELANDGAPFHKQRALAEVDGVVFQRVPEDLKDVALFGFDAAVDLVALETLGAHGHGASVAACRRRYFAF